MVRKYRHYIGVKLESGMFRELNRTVYDLQKASLKYTLTDFIREAIHEKLERKKIDSLLKENKN